MIQPTMVLLFFGSLSSLLAQGDPSMAKLLRRHYEPSNRLTYLMKGEDDGSTYEVRLTAVVKKGADGRFFEEYAFSDMISSGKPRSLSMSSQKFRQAVTLEGDAGPFSPPDLSQAPELVGPILALLTFYADLYLAIHEGALRKVGDHFYFPSPMTGSWADGKRVLIGQSAVDFQIELTGVDKPNGVCRLLIKHVPPKDPKIQIPAEWMRKPISDTPNNWVQVRRKGDSYVAAVGKETFDVELKISLVDGRILSATMENPVEKIARECTDAALTDCGEPVRSPTFRRIKMSLIE
jgi:hypothetical protein